MYRLQILSLTVYAVSSFYWLFSFLHLSSLVWENCICSFLGVFFFIIMLLARIQKKPCQFWCPEWVSCSSSINFKVSDLKYRSLIHFELVRDKGLILVSVCGHPNFQGHLCKNFPFSNAYSNFSKYAAKASTQCMFLPLLLHVSWLQMYGFISRVYILSYWSMDLISCYVLFSWFKKGRLIHRQRDRWRWIFHHLIHSQIHCNSRIWDSLKSGAMESWTSSSSSVGPGTPALVASPQLSRPLRREPGSELDHSAYTKPLWFGNIFLQYLIVQSFPFIT